MKAFHNDPKIKSKYLERVRQHREADELVQGIGYEEEDKTRGCAVGCTLDVYDHSRYPVELGIPEQLAFLEDRLFEQLPLELALQWPERFLSAIPVGADLSRVWPEWVIWMLTDPTHGMLQYAGDAPDVHEVIERVAKLYRTGGTKKQFTEAAEAAWAAGGVAEVVLWAARAARAAAAGAARAARAAAEAVWTIVASDKLITLLNSSP